ncbi:MAG: sugar ABC transporter permease [Spirochaetaceae bacterium]|nr:sugar ABC transporter permease [Spirochaetaceae bacterium]
MTALSKKKLNESAVFAIFTIPALICILLSVEIPFLMSVGYSFTKWNGLDKIPEFIGLENYREALFHDPDMLRALIFTISLTLATVILINIIALALAVLLDRDIRGMNALRAAFYIPNIISLIIIGYVWRFIFSQGFDSLYELTGWSIFQLSWLGDGKMAFLSISIVTTWQAIGFYLVIYLAGLQTVPRELIEASMLDGANFFTRFFYITLPTILPSITVAVFYSLSHGLKAFDVIMSLTNGGPGTATMSIALDIYRSAFIISRFGYGTAKSVILFILIMIFTVFQVKMFKQREVEL